MPGRSRSLAAVLVLALAGAASAVIIDSGAGTGNTSAPVPDPGWSHLGRRAAGTAVVIQDGWVLTAYHLSVGTVWLDGVPYEPVTGSDVKLGGGEADLRIFAVWPDPGLPPLPIASSSPAMGADLLLIGEGRDRGGSSGGDCNGPPPPSGGFEWAATRTMRWGTNVLELPTATVETGPNSTEAFGSFFDPGGSAHEAQAALGDSGGAVFAWTGSFWELAGMMFATSVCSGQPSSTSLYGNATYAVDLSVYRDEIFDVIAMPEPSGGLVPGVALLAALGRRRRGRSRSGS